MTLREIAAEAGVSISTVSRVLNKNAKSAASPQVQARILDIAARANYLPVSREKEAAPLSSPEQTKIQPLRSIACLFARVPDGETDFFFSTLASSIEKEASLHNYVLRYTFSSFDIDDPYTLQMIAANQVDGIAVLGRCDKPLLKFLRKNFEYVVYTGLTNVDAKYDQIICDGCEIGVALVDYLSGLGHQKIAYIGETKRETRYTGYCEGLKKNNITFHKRYVADVPLSIEGGYKGVNSLLRGGCDATAYFCADDTSAIGAMRAIKEHGLRIPEEISIVSVNDIDTAKYLSPMLTTVHIPVEEMGHMAAKTLIDRIEGGHQVHLKTLVPFYIQKRESCAPCPSR